MRLQIMEINHSSDSNYKEVRSRILKLAFPAILSNITVPLMGLSDTAISGHLGSAIFMAAIAAGTMMTNVVFWLFGFLRMGTTGLTAEFYGASDLRGIRTVFSRAFYLGLGAGILIVALSPVLCRLLLWLLSPEQGVEMLAAEYYMTVIFGAPAQLATMAVTGWFIGMQNTKRPMIVAITTNLINIVVSLTAVFALNSGFIGIAYGTLIANWAGLLLAIVLAIPFAKRSLFLSPLKVWKGGGLGRFFKISGDLFLRSACIMSVSMIVTAVGARLGADILAANAVIMQFFILFSYFMDGFAFSGEALCGKAVGEHNRILFKNTLRGLTFWGVTMTVLITGIYILASGEIINFITDDITVRRIVEKMFLILWLLPSISVASFLFDGIYIGLTATRQMLAATFSALVVFIIITFLLPEPIFRFIHDSSGDMNKLSEDIRLWIAFLAYLAARGVILALLLRKTSGKRF